MVGRREDAKGRTSMIARVEDEGNIGVFVLGWWATSCREVGEDVGGKVGGEKSAKMLGKGERGVILGWWSKVKTGGMRVPSSLAAGRKSTTGGIRVPSCLVGVEELEEGSEHGSVLSRRPRIGKAVPYLSTTKM